MKKCQKCHSENSADARFCIKCGHEFSPNSIFCPECGTKNEKNAGFCFKCGHALTDSTTNEKQTEPLQKKKKNIAAKRPGLNPVKIVAGLLALIIIYLIIPEDKSATSSQPVQRAQPVAEQKFPDPGKEAVAMDIASKFICSCGSCGEQPLETCTCEVARVERQYIRNELQNGKDMETIIRAVNSKYGWIKPQFEDRYGRGKVRFDEKINLPVPGSDILN